jgi:ribosomal protein S18 acetylase RimI-like enzyme
MAMRMRASSTVDHGVRDRTTTGGARNARPCGHDGCVPAQTSLLIRPVRPADDSPLLDLDRRCWSPAHDVTDGPASVHGTFLGEDVLVAEMAGRVVGYVKVAPPTPLPSNAHVQQVQGLLVDPEYRGRGIGQALLDAAVGLARRRGARRIWLRVLATNPGAQRLYAAAGFRVEGVLHGEFCRDGADVDDVLMGRRLD